MINLIERFYTLLSKQFLRFLLVGIFSAIVDFTIYFFLLSLYELVEMSKIIGFISGTVIAYFFNMRWTFSSSGGLIIIIKFVFVYLFSLIINVFLNGILVRHYLEFQGVFVYAFVLATVVSACINFLLMKFCVFNNK